MLIDISLIFIKKKQWISVLVSKQITLKQSETKYKVYLRVVSLVQKIQRIF